MSLSAQPNLGAGVLREVDLRRARRYSDKGSMIQASWIDAEGNVNVGMVRVVNISEGGLALELPVVPQQTAMVRIQSDRHKLAGTASVRHVTAQGSRCVVGLEFANGMRWQPPWERGEGPQELSPPADTPVRGTVTKTVGLTGIPVPLRPRRAEGRQAAETPRGPTEPAPETAQPEAGVSPQPEAAAGGGKPGGVQRLNGALPMPPARAAEAARPADITAAAGAAEKTQETGSLAETRPAGREEDPAAGSTLAKGAAGEEANRAGAQPAKPPASRGEPEGAAGEAAAQPVTAEEPKAGQAAPAPAETAATGNGESPANPFAAEPGVVEAAEKRLESLWGSEPATPESKADDLADFWGWAKQ